MKAPKRHIYEHEVFEAATSYGESPDEVAYDIHMTLTLRLEPLKLMQPTSTKACK